MFSRLRSDQDLIAAIAQGSDSAFRELYSRHNKKVLGYCTKIIGNRASAEDVAQEVWLKVIRRAATFTPHANKDQALAWVMTVARNSAFNFIRDSKQSEFMANIDEKFDLAADTKPAIEAMIDKSTTDEVKKAVATLPDQQRAALVLWMTEDLSYEEIAKEMGLTVAAVKSVLFRAKQALQKRLGVTNAE